MASLATRSDTTKPCLEADPERFPRGVPMVAAPPSEDWINPPHHIVVAPASALERGVLTKTLSRGHIEQLT